MPVILDIEILHGPPSLGGVLFPNANFNSPVRGIVNDLSRYKTLANGQIKKIGVERYRIRWELGWKALSQSDMESLIEILEQKEGFDFKPRTVLAGVDLDPSPMVNTYTVRCISDLVLTRMLVHDDYDINVQLETIDIITG